MEKIKIKRAINQNFGKFKKKQLKSFGGKINRTIQRIVD